MTRYARALPGLVLVACIAAGCTPSIPEGRFFCADDGDCPPRYACRESRCYAESGSVDQGAPCATHADCSDAVFCNGDELCSPSSVGADARGCLAGAPACPSGFFCSESARNCMIDCDMPDPDGDGHDSIHCGGDDCDDMDADRFPGNPETCLDGAGGKHDEDCDPTTFGYLDADGDGEVSSECCNDNGGVLVCGTDCDDSDRSRRSGQVEFCDLVDNDCDGRVDENTAAVDWYLDADGDGFGAPGVPVSSCTPVEGHSLFDTDCDDEDPARHPAQIEVCDLLDNNCNELVDEQPYCDAIVIVDGAGGTLTTTSSGGGAITVSVPPGALESATPLSIGEYHPRSLPPLAAGQRFVGLPVAFTPFDAVFAVPVTITLPVIGSNLVVLALDGSEDRSWTELEASFSGDFVTLTVTRGGIYAVANQVCGPGTWDHDGLEATNCVAWTDCAAGEFVASGGSAASDRECPACDDAYSTTVNATACVPHTVCPPGEHAAITATATRDRQCEACTSGTFTAVANEDECSAWSTCGAGTVQGAEGSATMDRECLSLTWTRQFGTAGADGGGYVAVNAAGEVYVVGTSATQLPGTPAAGGGVFVRKYSATGVELWSRHVSNTQAAGVLGARVGPSDSLYVGWRTGSGGGAVTRFSATGAEMWTTPVQLAFLNAFGLDPSGNAYLGGQVNGWSVGSNGQNAKLFKFNDAGVMQWGGFVAVTSAVIYNGPADSEAAAENIQAIAADATGNVYVAGWSGSLFTPSTGSGRSFLQRLSAADGAPVWTTHFGSPTLSLTANTNAIAISSDGASIYLTGQTEAPLPGQASLGGADAFVHRFTFSGAASWIRTLSTSGYDYGNAITVMPNGSVVYGGTVGDVLDPAMTFGLTDVFVETLAASTGAPLGRAIFGTSLVDNLSPSMGATSDGYIACGGVTRGALPFDEQTSAGNFDVFVRRMTPP